MSQVLKSFCQTYGLEFNYNKSIAFWLIGRESMWPNWTNDFKLPRASPNSIFTLLGIPFVLVMNFANLDDLLNNKIQCKLKCWSSTKLSTIGKVVVVNSIMLSMLWYFVNIWVGTKKRINKVRMLLTNYLWVGSANNYRC